ncbi:MAG TPA: TlpA disulfide reductase family protein [Hanamia sp.]|nr:TlpA disulfide reductase family protein [Hanamia sp.]
MKSINKIKIILFLLTFCYTEGSIAQLQGIKKIQASYISGTFHNLPVSDTISLTIWENIISIEKRNLIPARRFTAIVKNGKFKFQIDSVKSNSYISLGIGNFVAGKPYPFLDLYVLEPGDNINISISTNERIEDRDKIKGEVNGQKACLNCNNYNFTGKGALKYQYRTVLYKAKDSLQNNWYDTDSIAIKEPTSFKAKYQRSYSQMTFVKDRVLQILQQARGNISEVMYQLLEADAVAQCNFLFLADLANSYQPTQVSENDREIFKNFYTDSVLNRIRDDIPNDIQAISAFYPPTLIYKERLENKLYNQKSNYNRIKKNYSGALRDRILTNYLIDNLNRTGVDSLISDALSIMKESRDKEILISAQANSKVGTHLNFSLRDVNGNLVNLSDYKGKVVFIDFWFFGCGGCTTFYLGKLSKIEEFYKDNQNIVFLSISIDTDRNKWLKAIKSNSYTSEKAVNLTTGSLGELHPLIRKLNIMSYPALIVVDRNGNIASNDSDKLRASTSEMIKFFISKN